MTEDNNWKFSLDDLGDENSSSSSGESNFDGSSISTVGQGLKLLPFTVAGVFTFLQTSAVSASLSGFLGSGLTAALVTAVLAIGALTVAGIGVMAALVVVAFLAALVKRSAAAGILAFLGILYFGITAAVATFVFGSLPFLVAFVISSTVVIYVGMLIVLFFFGSAVLAMV